MGVTSAHPYVSFGFCVWGGDLPCSREFTHTGWCLTDWWKGEGYRGDRIWQRRAKTLEDQRESSPQNMSILSEDVHGNIWKGRPDLHMGTAGTRQEGASFNSVYVN